MKVYQVGGCVRDYFLNRKASDIDYVIVGATQDDIDHLLKTGYKQVGADFPVFLSPNGSEYALARVERKTGAGYLGFECRTENVTLEEDLYRRDFTMNAMARDPGSKEIIDPYGGMQDLTDGIIRHVSDAFREDPVRVLRAARFAARYEFSIHESTVKMIRDMAQDGSLSALQHNRVMLEIVKAAEGTNSGYFFSTLRDCGAWEPIFGDIPKINSFQERLINNLVYMSDKDRTMDSIVFGLLFPVAVAEWDKIQARMVFPSKSFAFAKCLISEFENFSDIENLTAEEVVKLYDRVSITNKGGYDFLNRAYAIVTNMSEASNRSHYLADKCYGAYSCVSAEEVIAEFELQHNKKPTGLEIKEALFNARVSALKKLIGV